MRWAWLINWEACSCSNLFYNNYYCVQLPEVLHNHAFGQASSLHGHCKSWLFFIAMLKLYIDGILLYPCMYVCVCTCIQDEVTLQEHLLRFKVWRNKIRLYSSHFHHSTHMWHESMLVHMYTHTTHPLQHKTRALVSTTKGTQHLAGEIRSASDLDFYVDGVSLFCSWA